MSERQEKLLDLLERCYELAEQGLEVRPTELCAEWNCPELLQELQAQLRLERWVVPQGIPVPDPSAFPDVAPAIPNHDILELLGRGGMGVVYKARDHRLKRLVAVKVIGTGVLASGQLARFQVEAEALARLDHPHIVRVYEGGSWQAEAGVPLPYLSMEYVPGETLEKRLGCDLAKPADAAHLLLLLARAVQHAHRKGIIHRDLKPGNVMLASPKDDQPALNCAWGLPKLTDFGLARRVEEGGLTQRGAVLGTPNYMAPEQANGRIDEMGPKVDVYGLGGILYRLLTGQHPFRDANRHTAPPSPRSQHTSVPEKLSMLCMRCLAPTPADRPSVADLIRDLEQFLSGDPAATTTAPALPSPQPGDRHPSDELNLLQQRIDRLTGLAGDYRDRMTNCLKVAGSPPQAVTLARSEGERLVKQVLEAMTIRPPAMLDGCLRKLEKPEVMSRGLVPLEIVSLLHAIRVLGNKAAHDALKIGLTGDDVHLVALALVRVVEWYFAEFERGPRVQLPPRPASVRRTVGPWAALPPPPEPPRHYVRRPVEELGLARDLLRQDGSSGVVVSALFGLGGIGKSTLAAAVLQDREVRERFTEGVLWVTLGQSPELQALVGQCIRDLGDYEFRAVDLRSASARLRQLLQDRAVLLVVDDAWQSEHVEPFQVGGSRCRLLVTTRKPRIADDLHAISHELNVLSHEQSVELLATRLQRPLREDERCMALRLAEAVGHLPLALELAAVRLGRGVAWEDLLLKLEQEVAALEVLEDPAKPWKKKVKTQLEASLQLSLRALREEAEEAFRCFVWLGVLRDDTTLAAPMASTLWDLADAEEADGLLEFLWGEALLQPAAAVRVGGKEWRGYRVHDLLHDCARRLLEAPSKFGGKESLPGLGLTRAKAHRQLLERYGKRTQNGQWHTLAADGYIHGRLGWHLEQAGDTEGLHALLREETPERRNGWYEANEQLGQPNIFADCVSQAWRLADQAFREGWPGSPLGLQCRYALVTASLNSLARNIPPGLLEALVSLGLWTIKRALVEVLRNPDSAMGLESLVVLRPHLPLGLQWGGADEFQAALQAALTIENKAACSRALVRLAPHLPPSLLVKAFELAQAIKDSVDRFEALLGLASYMPAALFAEVLEAALQAAQTITVEKDRTKALVALAPQLPACLLAEAFQAARAIKNDAFRFTSLRALAQRMPRRESRAVFVDALIAAWHISSKRSRSATLKALGPQLPPWLLAEALEIARDLGDATALTNLTARLSSGVAQDRGEEYRKRLLERVQLEIEHRIVQSWKSVLDVEDKAAYSRAQELIRQALSVLEQERSALLADALTAIRTIGEESVRAALLTKVLPYLPSNILTEGLGAARNIGNLKARSRMLTVLAPRLPEQERATVLTEALAAARAIGDEMDCNQALAALVPHLPEQERAPILTKLLNAAREIGDAEAHSQALIALAPYLPSDLRTEILISVHNLPDEGARIHALVEIAGQLSGQEGNHRSAVLTEALTTARAIRHSFTRSRALNELAPHLPERESATVLADALTAARAIRHEELRLLALIGMAAQLPEQERVTVLTDAVTAVHSRWGSEDRSQVLTVLAPQLPSDFLTEAVAAAHSIRHEGCRIQALAALAMGLPEQERTAVLTKALTDACAIKHQGARSQALTALVRYRAGLSGPTRSPLWTQSLPVLAARTRPDLLADFCSLVPLLAALAGPNAPTELREVARAITDVARWWP